LIRFLKKEAEAIKKNGGKPGLLIQGDKRVKCKYITSIIKISTRASFANVYFSTIKADSKEQIVNS
jgi:biopolymer transport protein ExbD